MQVTMKNMGSVFFAFLLLILSGCVTMQPAVPEGYAGPVAIVKDSYKQYSSSKADFFYLSEVDGQPIKNSRMETISANQGRGMHMAPVNIERNVPARAGTYTIVGRTHYAAPILSLTSTVYQVNGNVKFSPEPYKNYVVRGVLGPDYSAVWIEEEPQGKQVSEKVEIKGSTALGAFEK